MHCPQCGQQQVSEVVRFCSRCGFPLDGVIQLLANGGLLPVYRAADEPVAISPRRRGVRQGAILFLAGVLVVPILGILNAFVSGESILDILVPMAAILFFLGGLMRMLYAAIFEEGTVPRQIATRGSYVAPAMPTQLAAPARSALPPPPANPVLGWQQRPNTAEIVQPPSVTENTTRLLDDQSDPN